MITSPLELLYVEDDPTDAMLFKRALASAGGDYRLHHLTDGEAAVAFVSEATRAGRQLPQLAVIDVKLPKVLGFDVLSHIRTTAKSRLLPVLMMSGSSERSDIERAYALGANAYVRKPATYTELKDFVTHLTKFWLCYAQPPYAN